MSQFIKGLCVRITALNSKTTETLELYYSVLDTDISRRWINLIDQNNDRGNSLTFNYRRNLSDEDIQLQFEEFKNNVSFINKRYDRSLTELDTFEHLEDNQDILNDLHEEYEIYGDRLEQILAVNYFSNPLSHPNLYHPVWPGMNHDKEVHNSFLKLNEQIHNFEAVYRSKANGIPAPSSCLIDFLPAGLHEELQPEDYFLFSAERFWGWGFLGYNTLGKHWYTVCWDNDTDVVARNQVRPQERFAAEFYMNFSQPEPYDSNFLFYNWWKNNNFSNIKDPTMKLNEFAFGYIPVSKLTSYSINNLEKIVITPRTQKMEWNQSVWGRFDTITEFKVLRFDE